MKQIEALNKKRFSSSAKVDIDKNHHSLRRVFIDGVFVAEYGKDNRSPDGWYSYYVVHFDHGKVSDDIRRESSALSNIKECILDRYFYDPAATIHGKPISLWITEVVDHKGSVQNIWPDAYCRWLQGKCFIVRRNASTLFKTARYIKEEEAWEAAFSEWGKWL